MTLIVVTHPSVIARVGARLDRVELARQGPFDDVVGHEMEPATRRSRGSGVDGVTSWTVARVGPNGAVVAAR